MSFSCSCSPLRLMCCGYRLQLRSNYFLCIGRRTRECMHHAHASCMRHTHSLPLHHVFIQLHAGTLGCNGVDIAPGPECSLHSVTFSSCHCWHCLARTVAMTETAERAAKRGRWSAPGAALTLLQAKALVSKHAGTFICDLDIVALDSW